MDRETIQFVISGQLFLETLLMERGQSISYASYLAKERNNNEDRILKEITEIESCQMENDKETILLFKRQLA